MKSSKIKYRKLIDGEIIKKTDEFFSVFRNWWVKATEANSVGDQFYYKEPHTQYRRPIKERKSQSC